MQQSMTHVNYHGKMGYLLRNVDVGIWEFAGMGYFVNDVMIQTIKSQLMMSCGSHTKNNHTNQSHKQIAQKDCGRQDDITSKNGNDK